MKKPPNCRRPLRYIYSLYNFNRKNLLILIIGNGYLIKTIFSRKQFFAGKLDGIITFNPGNFFRIIG
ncbi:hypothetical protein DHD80_03740 [Gramella sp. AN32]|nr:hypothetical protein [Gramella sp. AN32]